MFSAKCQRSWVRGCRSRSLSLSAVCPATHYEELEVPPRATQAQIKTAYYRLSKLYHPDVNDDEKAARKFRSITEAYEVLGNLKTKRLYDRGVYGSTFQSEDRSSTSASAAGPGERRPGDVRTRPPDGRTNLYDIDAWTREHYGRQFQRTQWVRNNYKESKVEAKAELHTLQLQKISALLMIAVVFFGLQLIGLKNKHDIINDKIDEKIDDKIK